MSKCPCCGGAVDARKLLVSVDTKRVSHNGKTVKVQWGAVRVIKALADAWPRTLSAADLMDAVWGNKEPPNTADIVVRVYVANAKKSLEQVGFGVENFPSAGYRIKMPENS